VYDIQWIKMHGETVKYVYLLFTQVCLRIVYEWENMCVFLSVTVKYDQCLS